MGRKRQHTDGWDDIEWGFDVIDLGWGDIDLGWGDIDWDFDIPDLCNCVENCVEKKSTL